MTRAEIVEKYSTKAKEQRRDYGLCPHPNCDGYGKCLCCINADGCLELAEEYEKIVANGYPFNSNIISLSSVALSKSSIDAASFISCSNCL